MDNIYKQIETLISNARKSIGKVYTADTLVAKRKEVERLELQTIEILEDPKISKVDRDSNVERFGKLKGEALEILRLHEQRDQQSSSQQARDIGSRETGDVDNTMTDNVLNTTELAAISKLIPIFNGAKGELEIFLANLEIVQETIVPEKHTAFFNFIYKTKLTSKVQNKIRQIAVPIDIATLRNSLKRAYGIKKSPNVILNELTTIVQTESIRKFADQIETLMMELNELQTEALGEASREIISNTNAIIAFNSFKNGLKNREVVRTIEASRKKTLHEAIEIALETSADIRQSQIMFQTARSRGPDNNNRNTNDNRNGKRNSYNSNFNNNANGNRNSDNSKCGSCGGKHGDRCYAQGKTCDKCGKPNHFAKVCRSGNNSNAQNNGNSRRRNNNYDNENGNRSRRVHHVQEQGNSQDPEVLMYQDSPDQN